MATGGSTNTLALNTGSGPLCYKLMAVSRTGAHAADEVVVREGSVDHVHRDATIKATEQAVAECTQWGIDAIGYRVAHGGMRFEAPASTAARTALWLVDCSSAWGTMRLARD
jgi:acetate kinase